MQKNSVTCTLMSNMPDIHTLYTPSLSIASAGLKLPGERKSCPGSADIKILVTTTAVESELALPTGFGQEKSDLKLRVLFDSIQTIRATTTTFIEKYDLGLFWIEMQLKYFRILSRL